MFELFRDSVHFCNNYSYGACLYYLEFPYLFASRLPEEFSVLEGNRVLLEVKTQDEEVRTDTLSLGFV